VILAERTETVTIVGKFCESGDVLVPETRMPRLVPGDVIAMWGTGAYTFSMASNYNRFARPAMVLVHAGRAEVISERETLADLVSRDRLPARLTQGRQP
jgi:diaminopimelate decarboxylase